MNSDQAKRLSLPEIMRRLGYSPVRSEKGGNELWYNSPFRQETEPSFHTSYLGGKWIWNDFGDIGGTVIDFVMRHENLSSVKDALSYLKNTFATEQQRISDSGQTSLFSFQQQPSEAGSNSEVKSQIEFVDAHPISHPAIFDYLEQDRLIPSSIFNRYLVEVKYRNIKKGREYFAFGMKNEAGGYEIRSASDTNVFKSSLNSSDVSLIETGSQNSSVYIFEGMIDFLSLLVLYGLEDLSGDAIVMHSLSSFQRTKDILEERDYALINSFLDNDRSGLKTTEDFVACFSSRFKPQNDMYANHKDLNEALVANSPSF